MKILLLGKNGQVGWELQRSLQPLGEVVSLDMPEVDLGDPDSVGRTVGALRADVIVNAAAYTAVDRAESDEATATRVNGDSVAVLARIAAAQHAWLIHYSTDYVFDGSGSTPWRETDAPAPLNAYGRSKLKGERAIQASGCRHLIFRTSWVYAARGQNFVRTILRLATERDQLRVIADQHGVPTSAEFLADMTALAISRVVMEPAREVGSIYHLVPRGETSWHGIASAAVGRAIQLGVKMQAMPESIHAIGASEYPLPAPRPGNSRLCVDRVEQDFGIRCPDWRVHLDRTVAELTKGADA
jgi:dTDP-4-dehydrorhamnose reductase